MFLCFVFQTKWNHYVVRTHHFIGSCSIYHIHWYHHRITYLIELCYFKLCGHKIQIFSIKHQSKYHASHHNDDIIMYESAKLNFKNKLFYYLMFHHLSQNGRHCRLVVVGGGERLFVFHRIYDATLKTGVRVAV